MATFLPLTAMTWSPALSPARPDGDADETEESTHGCCPDRVSPNPDWDRLSSTVRTPKEGRFLLRRPEEAGTDMVSPGGEMEGEGSIVHRGHVDCQGGGGITH